MKHFWISLVLLIGMMLYGCDSQPIPTHAPTAVGNILSRTTIGSESLSVESQALFHATGGLELSGKVLTLTESGWTDEEDNTPLAFDSSVETRLTALYPVTNNAGDTITRNPYNQNALIDVLIAQDTLINSTDAHLLFQHRFSKLTFHIDPHLQDAITGITLTAPKIASIDLESGNLTFDDENYNTTTLTDDGSGQYTFIIPPYEDCNLTLTFIMSDNTTKTHPLQHTFDRGCQYTCNVTSTDTRPGIRNAADLIAFCELINKPKTYTGTRNLDEFRTIIDNDTVYYLLADIELTESQSKKLYPIGGYNNNYPFTNTFEGNGHTISKLTLQAYNGYVGLFGKITPPAIIRNLKLDYCKTPTIEKSTAKGAGFIAGRCDGIIDNCSVTNCTITNNKNTYTGGMVGKLMSGTILNSFVDSTKIIVNDSPIGGLAGYISDGNIQNCYSANSTIKNTGTTSARGGIAGETLNSVITNSYVYNLTFDSNSTNKGQFVGRGTNTTINYCYYDLSLTLIKDKTNCTTENNEKYNSNFLISDNTPVYSLLHQQANDNPSFMHWEESDNLPAIMISKEQCSICKSFKFRK